MLGGLILPMARPGRAAAHPRHLVQAGVRQWQHARTDPGTGSILPVLLLRGRSDAASNRIGRWLPVLILLHRVASIFNSSLNPPR